MLRLASPLLFAAMCSGVGLHCSLDGLDEFSRQWGTDAANTDSIVPPGDSAPLPPLDGADDGVAGDAIYKPPSAVYGISDYCGGSSRPACPAASPCPTALDGLVGRACDKVGDRCVVAGVDMLATKVFACLGTGKSIWQLNGLALAAWGGTPGTFPVCIAGVEGASCTTLGDRCVTSGGERLFRCVPGGFPMWVFDDHCSNATYPASFVGDCSAASLPTCSDANVTGTACPTTGSRCVMDNKIFRCIER